MTTDNRHALDIARAQAAGYVWGRQDAGESNRDTGYSIDFANWYADKKQAYLEGQAGSLASIQDSYAEWQQIRQQPAAEALPEQSAAEEQQP